MIKDRYYYEKKAKIEKYNKLKVNMDDINILLKSNNQIKTWKQFDERQQHIIILHLFKNENRNKNVCDLIINLLKYLTSKDGACSIKCSFVNLLCIVLAKTHNKKYLQYIVMTKMAMNTDYYCSIDSNLLFEFSPNKNRETSVIDTLNYVDDKVKNKDWYKKYRKMVIYYANIYDSNIVIKNWNRYKTKKYLDEFSEYIIFFTN